MMKVLPVLLLMMALFIRCSKDKDDMATGTVLQAGGCFPDAWLVELDNPDPRKHFFIRATSVPAATLYNCSNAVFIRLAPPLASPGTKIRFSAKNIEPSCLSYSESPNIITVKKIYKL